jgi:hypothetical protein
MSRFATNRWIKTHPNNVYTHGSTEPILSILDVRGFELYDLFLVGLNDSCGAIYFPTEDRARAAAQALEPAYATEVVFEAHPGARARGPPGTTGGRWTGWSCPTSSPT